VVLQAASSAIGAEAKPATDDSQQITTLAQSDFIALIELAAERYKQDVRDYTGTLTKQERIGRKLSKMQVIDFKFTEKPFRGLMTWTKNAGSADKLLFVEGANDDKALIHLTGLLSVIDSLKIDPNGKRAAQSSRQPCNKFGFGRTLKRTLDICKLAQKRGELKTRYLGPKVIDKRKCIGIERTLPKKEPYTAARMVVYFDVEYILPTSTKLYDWDGKLLGDYAYTNLKFNVDLKAEQFTAKSNGL